MRRPDPNFERFLKVVRRQGEPERVPFAEFSHDYEIMAAIQGPSPSDADGAAAWRAKFWHDLEGVEKLRATGELAKILARYGLSDWQH